MLLGGCRSLTKHSALFIVYSFFIYPAAGTADCMEIWVAARGWTSTKSFGPEV